MRNDRQYQSAFARAACIRLAALITVLGVSIGNAVVWACPNAKVLEPYVQTTAGTGAPGTTNGPVTRATFVGPTGVALGSDSSVYVADEFGQNIRQIKDGIVRTIAGTSAAGSSPQERIGGYRDGPAALAQFNHPSGVAVAPDGTIYVADTANHRIRRISRGVVTTFAGGGSGSPDGIGTNARFMRPQDIAIDGDGNLYVADNGIGLRKITPDGTVSTILTDGQTDVCGVAARGSGRGTIVAYTDSKQIFIREGDYTGALPYGELTEPQGEEQGPGFACRLAIYDRYTIVVSDPRTSAVRFARFRIGAPVGTGAVIRTLVNGRHSGGAITAGYLDGPSERALADEPSGVAIAPDNSVFFADTGNRRIRRVRDIDPRGALYPDMAGLLDVSNRDYRIVVVGDSFSYYNVMWNESMQGQIEAGLAAQGSRYGLRQCPRVVAVRLSGVSFSATLSFIDSYLADGGVDLVIVSFGYEPFAMEQRAHPELSTSQLKKRLAAQLADTQRQLNTNGAKLLIVPVPHGAQVSPLETGLADDFPGGFLVAERYEGFLAESGVLTLRLANLMERAERSNHRVPFYNLFNTHPSPQGLRWIGNAILDFIEQWKPWNH